MARLGSLVRSVAVDTSALRESRDYRLLVLGGFVSGLGSQVTLVALPFQVYLLTHSSFMVGLIGLVELAPFIAFGLVGGALADRVDRRRLLLLSQVGMLITSAGLALGAAHGSPPLALVFALAALAAGGSAIDRPTRAAIVPNLVGPARLRSAISFNYGLFQLTVVIGPAVGGIVIAAFGLTWAYTLDVVTFLAMIASVLLISPQPPAQAPEGGHEPFLRSVTSGLRFAAERGELMGSFVIDILAMTFGMPRALFPALSLTLYHAGATGVGLLYTALSAGAVVAAFTTGWLTRARRLGRITVFAVLLWGIGIALMGLTSSLVVAMACLCVAGAADSVSAVCRSTILQTATPDRMRGRMSSVFTLVVAGGPRVGDVESGSVAAAVGTQASVVLGGLACIAGLLPVVLAFPAFWNYDEGDAAALAATSPQLVEDAG
ncbi:MAG TPA: MFS transporter [Gaiellales bacterium]|nr:MFS transporter [Gaiellales bacterium]